MWRAICLRQAKQREATANACKMNCHLNLEQSVSFLLLSIRYLPTYAEYVRQKGMAFPFEKAGFRVLVCGLTRTAILVMQRTRLSIKGLEFSE